jgi:hypothetical protein
MTPFWDDLDAIKQAIEKTEDNITRWTIRAKLGFSVRECELMIDALYDEIIDLCVRRDELDDALTES